MIIAELNPSVNMLRDLPERSVSSDENRAGQCADAIKVARYHSGRESFFFSADDG